MNEPITIETYIEAPIEKIWEYWTTPEHITKWCLASSDWHVPRATNDVTVGRSFLTRMESLDGKNGFDFEGIYTDIEQYKKIAYVMADGRKVEILFEKDGDGYNIIETFDPEHENPVEIQRAGWQSILDNFKKYVLNS